MSHPNVESLQKCSHILRVSKSAIRGVDALFCQKGAALAHGAACVERARLQELQHHWEALLCYHSLCYL